MGAEQSRGPLYSRREFIINALKGGAGVIGAVALGETGLDILYAKDQELSDIVVLPYSSLPQEVVTSLGNADINSFTGRNPESYSSQTVVLTPDQYRTLKQSIVLPPGIISSLDSTLSASPDSAQIECVLTCNDKNEMQISAPTLRVKPGASLSTPTGAPASENAVEYFGRGGVFQEYKPRKIGNENTVITYMVYGPATEQYLKGPNFPTQGAKFMELVNKLKYGDILMIETTQGSPAVPVSVLLENEVFPLTAMLVGAGARRRELPDANAKKLNDTTRNASYVTTFEVSLNDVQKQFPSVAVVEDDKHRISFRDKQYVWYYNKDADSFAWSADVSIKNIGNPDAPSIAATAQPINPEISAAAPTATPAASATEAKQPEAERVQEPNKERVATQEPAVRKVDKAEGQIILYGNIESTVQFPMSASDVGYDIIAFYIISFTNKYGEQEKVAVPAALNPTDGGNTHIIGYGAGGSDQFSFRFTEDMVVTALGNFYNPGDSVKISCADKFYDKGKGIYGTVQYETLFEKYYHPGDLELFTSSEDPSTLPNIGEINGVRILMGVHIEKQ